MTHATRPPVPRQWLLALVLTSYLMIVLDISIVITGLPQIQRNLVSPQRGCPGCIPPTR